MPCRFAKWKRDAEHWFVQDSLMFEGHLDKVADDLVSSRSCGTPMKWVIVSNTRLMESIDQVSVLQCSQLRVNITFRNARGLGSLVTCCRSQTRAAQFCENMKITPTVAPQV